MSDARAPHLGSELVRKTHCYHPVTCAGDVRRWPLRAGAVPAFELAAGDRRLIVESTLGIRIKVLFIIAKLANGHRSARGVCNSTNACAASEPYG